MPDATINIINVSDLQAAQVGGRQVDAGDYQGYAPFVIIFGKEAGGGWVPLTVGADGVLATSPVAWKPWIASPAVLAASATYTSASDNDVDWTMITGHVGSNVAGTLYIDHCENSAFAANTFSSDSMAYPGYWLDSSGAAVAVGTVVQFEAPRFANYARVRYINGGTIQTWFTLAAGLKTIVR
jgi:hypothetical protein